MSRYGIMANQLLATLTTDHHLLKCEIVVYLVNLRHPLHSIPLDVCFVSQLERCFYVSFRELIMWSLRWSIHADMFRSFVLVLVEDLESKDVKINLSRQINNLEKTVGSWSLWYLVSPLSSYLMYWISGWDSCLVGVSCHIPSFWQCTRLASCVHHV